MEIKEIKVSEKRAVSVYGIRRFPITFYREEWLFILSNADQIKAFIANNAEHLKSKQ